MHEKHQTQLQVQEKLGWSRTYISQLLNRNKKLRFDQVLGILSALEIEPPRFFAEVFADRDKARLPATLSGKRAELVVASMARVLVEKGILGTGELEAAITFMEKQEKTS